MGHFLGMNSRVHPKYKTKYRVSNWAEYDRALVERGNITLWISDDAIAPWKPAQLDDEVLRESSPITRLKQL